MIKANEMHAIAMKAQDEAIRKRVERTESYVADYIEPQIKHLAEMGNTHCTHTITARDVDFTLIEAILKENGFEAKRHNYNKIGIYW